MENDQSADPYEAVLADLRSQKERIETAISLLESLRAGGAPGSVKTTGAGVGASSKPKEANKPTMGPGALLGMSIPDAAKKVLHSNHRPMSTVELVPELERGGVVMRASDKVNNLGSILLRRFYDIGDIVRISRGVWGLQEWYPGRKFPGGRAKAQNGTKVEEQNGTYASAVENVEETESDKPTGAPADWINELIGGSDD
jgi:hypothetical protein